MEFEEKMEKELDKIKQRRDKMITTVELIGKMSGCKEFLIQSKCMKITAVLQEDILNRNLTNLSQEELEKCESFVTQILLLVQDFANELKGEGK